MIRKQLYSPDTCSCTIEEQYDDSVNPIVYTLSQYIERCNDHDALVQTTTTTQQKDQDAYKIMKNENQTKNKVLGFLITGNIFPLTMLESVDNFDSKTQTKTSTSYLHNRINYNYYFKNNNNDPFNRQIIFSMEGLDKNGNVIKFSNNDKISISSALDTKLGVGKHQVIDILHTDSNPEYSTALSNRLNKKIISTFQGRKIPTPEEQDKINLKNKIKDFFTK